MLAWVGTAAVVAVVLLFAVPTIAQAYWVKDPPGMPTLAGWAEYNDDGTPTGRTMDYERYSLYVQELEAFETQAGATGQLVPASVSARASTAAETARSAMTTCTATVSSLCSGVKGEAMSLLEKAGTIPLMRTLGTIGLAASSFDFGWQIGSKLSSLLFPAEPAQTQTYHVNGVVMESAGDSLNPTVPATVPSAGAVVNWTGTGLKHQKLAPGDTGSCGLYDAPPAGSLWVQAAPDTPGICTPGYDWLPLQVDALPGDAGSGQGVNKTSSAPPPSSDSQLRGAANWCLSTPVVCSHLFPYLAAHDGLDNGTSGPPITDPTGQPIGAPFSLPNFGDHEDYHDYDETLRNDGLKPQDRQVSDQNLDPDHGPDEVIKVHPDPGSLVQPGDQVTVTHNPPDAPPPDTGGGGGGPFDFGPVANIGIPCTKFPFGVFCWMYDGLGGWAGNAGCGGGGSNSAMTVDVPLKSHPRSGGAPDTGLSADLCQFDPAVQIMRPVELIVAVFSLVWFFSSAALGLGGDAAAESD